MSIVGISGTLGSSGDEIGRELARTLSCEFADQAIIVGAAERFGEDVRKLERFTEQKPGLLERFTDTRDRYRIYVEAVIWELAARDKVVLSGRGSAFVLRPVRHVLRVRITAPEALRITRVQQRQGLTPDAATQAVRQNDRERAGRVKSLYQMDWDDPLVYDLVINTEGLAVLEGVQIIQQALRGERFQPPADARREIQDLSVAAGAKAALLADPRTRGLWLSPPPSCRNGQLSLAGVVDGAELRRVVEEIVAKVPGVTEVVNEIVVETSGTRGGRAR
jgi:cytidylate kinase